MNIELRGAESLELPSLSVANCGLDGGMDGVQYLPSETNHNLEKPIRLNRLGPIPICS